MTSQPKPAPPYLPPAVLVAADYLKTSIHHEMTQAQADAAIAEVLKEVKR